MSRGRPRASALRSHLWVLGSLLSLHNCSRAESVTNAEITRVAVRALFMEREHAQAITVWSDTATSLVLESLHAPDAAPLVVFDSATLALPLRLEVANRDTMEAFFKAHPAGWDAWWRSHPSNAGLIEIAKPMTHDNDASIVIARTCGDQCRTAWRVSLKRISQEWRLHRITPLPISP